MSSDETAPFGAARCRCRRREQVLLGHGSGGKLTAELIEQPCSARVPQPGSRRRSTTRPSSPAPGARLAFTTDSYVVTPLFFPGGDIGELAVNGTVNDLAMGGARPVALSLALHPRGGIPARRARARRRLGPARRRRAPACCSSPATPRWSSRGKADRSSSTPPASASCPTGVQLGSARVRAGRRGPALGHHRRSRHGDHGAPRGARARGRSRERHRAAARAGRAMLARGPERPRLRDPDPRRRGRDAGRDRHPAAARHRARRARHPGARRGARRLRAARARSAARRQRGQAGRLRPRRRRAARVLDAMRAHPARAGRPRASGA